MLNDKPNIVTAANSVFIQKWCGKNVTKPNRIAAAHVCASWTIAIRYYICCMEKKAKGALVTDAGVDCNKFMEMLEKLMIEHKVKAINVNLVDWEQELYINS